MTAGPRSNFTPHLAVGFGFIFIGGVLALDRLGVVPMARSLQFWPIGLILLGVVLVANALRGGSPDQPQARDPFPVGPAVLLMVFVLVFARPFRASDHGDQTSERPKLVAVMGGDNRTSLAEPFRGAEMTSIMGGTVLDLRKATIAPGDEAVIDVFTVMGGAVVRVPVGWTVDVRVVPVMGGVNDERRRPSGASAALDAEGTQATTTPPRLVLKGSVLMGGVVIKN